MILDVLYLSTVRTSSAKIVLEKALSSLLATVADGQEVPPCIYQLYYEQSVGASSLNVDGSVATFSSCLSSLAFDDSLLDSVQQAWELVTGSSGQDKTEYMRFEDREGGDDDDAYD